MLRTIWALPLLATPAFADPEGYGHMMDWGPGYGHGMGFGPLLVLVLLVAGAVWLYRRNGAEGASSARAVLDMRFAKGEIDAEEYAARKKVLTA